MGRHALPELAERVELVLITYTVSRSKVMLVWLLTMLTC